MLEEKESPDKKDIPGKVYLNDNDAIPSTHKEINLEEVHEEDYNRVDDLKPTFIHIKTKDDRNVPCKPDGMLVGPDNPFFFEQFGKKRIPGHPHVKYDVIGPFGNEPDPDLDMYPQLSPPKGRGNFPDMFGPDKFF